MVFKSSTLTFKVINQLLNDYLSLYGGWRDRPCALTGFKNIFYLLVKSSTCWQNVSHEHYSHIKMYMVVWE